MGTYYTGDSILKQLRVNKKNIVRICLNKCTLRRVFKT